MHEVHVFQIFCGFLTLIRINTTSKQRSIIKFGNLQNSPLGASDANVQNEPLQEIHFGGS